MFIPSSPLFRLALSPFSTQTLVTSQMDQASELMDHAAHGQSLQRTGELERTSDWKTDYELTKESFFTLLTLTPCHDSWGGPHEDSSWEWSYQVCATWSKTPVVSVLSRRGL